MFARYYALFTLLGIIVTPMCLAQTDSSELNSIYDIPLVDLVKVKHTVPGAITKLSDLENISSVTTISETEIQNSAARNINDLIEMYVPGAIWTNHEKGPSLGIRGHIRNRNLGYLLLVNGRVINNKGNFGAKSELEQWDLNDIEKIEVIRGPGSVTYGPGAVAGVISITTKQANEKEKIDVSTKYVYPYNSKALSLALSNTFQKWKLYTYASVVSTEGYVADHYLANSNFEFGKIGVDVYPGSVPLDYFGDFNNEPQVKVHLGFRNDNVWSFWLRYAQQGSHWASNETKTEYDGEFVNQQGTQDKQFIASANHTKNITERISLNTNLSFDSYDSERRADGYAPNVDFDHPFNTMVNFAEHEIFGRTLLNMEFNEMEVAIGLEYSWDYFGKGWGDNNNEMRMGSRGVIVNDGNSLAIEVGNPLSADAQGTVIYGGDGWSTNTYSIFSELNYDINNQLKILLSGRMDKNSFTPWLISPRLAFVYKINPINSLRLSATQSVRMNTAAELYIENSVDLVADQEKLRGAELIYSSIIKKKVRLQFSSYYNLIEIVSFQGDIGRTNLTGNLTLLGSEIDLSYKSKRVDLSLSYAYVKQLNWEMAEGVERTGISYTDYDKEITHPPYGVFTITGTGNDLNNIPNQVIKLNGRYALSKRISFQLTSRLLYDYQGAKDGITALENAVAGSSLESDMVNVVHDIEAKDTFGANLFIDMSLLYNITDRLSCQLYGYNLTGNGGNKRYPWLGGSSRLSPNKVRFIEEPIGIGFRVRLTI